MPPIPCYTTPDKRSPISHDTTPGKKKALLESKKCTTKLPPPPKKPRKKLPTQLRQYQQEELHMLRTRFRNMFANPTSVMEFDPTSVMDLN